MRDSNAPQNGEKKINIISFDIDGTMEFGNPSGLVTVEMVKAEIVKGNAIISCSGHIVANQIKMFKEHGIELQMACLKGGLREAKRNWNVNVERYIHIGDDEIDKEAAEFARFEYMTPEEYVESLK